MYDKVNKSSDKPKIVILIIVIVFIVVLIVAFLVLSILDFASKDEPGSKISTTTRRTTTSRTTTESTTTETTTTTTTTTSSNVVITLPTVKPSLVITTKKTNAPTTKKTGTTTKSTTTTTTTTVQTRPIATGDSTVAGALSEWEWKILELINTERKKNGLKEVKFAKDMRSLAETAAKLILKDEKYMKDSKMLVSGFGNYMRKGETETVNSLYENTRDSTNITTEAEYTYVGIGVLLLTSGETNRLTVYYAFIYE